jgi:hypothetical protein
MRFDKRQPPDHEIELITDYANWMLPLATASLPDEYFYQSLPLCVIDAVWSLGVRYAGVQRVVTRYCEHSRLPKIRVDRRSLPLQSEQETIAAFCAKLEQIGPEAAAAEVFGNRQRTSARSGVLKAEAVYRFALALGTHGLDCLQDVPAAAANPHLEAIIRSIPGQGSGISLYYFWMLAGSDDFIKPDRMIRRFLESIIARPVSPSEAQHLVRGAAERLRLLHPHLTPRLLDYEIWRYQRERDGDSRRTPTCRSSRPAGSRCSPSGR